MAAMLSLRGRHHEISTIESTDTTTCGVAQTNQKAGTGAPTATITNVAWLQACGRLPCPAQFATSLSLSPGRSRWLTKKSPPDGRSRTDGARREGAMECYEASPACRVRREGRCHTSEQSACAWSDRQPRCESAMPQGGCLNSRSSRYCSVQPYAHVSFFPAPSVLAGDDAAARCLREGPPQCDADSHPSRRQCDCA